MRIGIMQPYFLPYLGYWQLIHTVDKFVILDDVNFIKGGWINRNRYLYQGEAKIFTINLKDARSSKIINEIEIAENGNKFEPMKKNLGMFAMAYKKKAPEYQNVIELINKIESYGERNLSKYITNSIREICKYLEIETEIIVSSEMDKTKGLLREHRVVDICKRLGGDMYINPIGGKELYTHEFFGENGLELKFIRMDDLKYQQVGDEFLPSLSILDVLMFNSKEKAISLLDLYTLED